MGRLINATPRPIYSWERPGTHFVVGWVGPRDDLDVCENNAPPLGFDPRTGQPVASRFTYRAIPASCSDVRS